MANNTAITEMYENLPKIAKILLEIFFGGVIAGVYRILRFLETKNTVTLYNKDTRTTIYLGDFKPQEFGNAASAPAPQDDSEKEGEDLPF